MVRYIALFAGLVLANAAFAATQDNSAVVSDKDNAVMLTSSKNTWAVVALNEKQGLTKVREFHDMGASGVQQIDYVVNCAENTLALAGFTVLTEKGPLPARAVRTSFSDLSFYKPALEHDKSIASNICEKRLAMGAASINN